MGFRVWGLGLGHIERVARLGGRICVGFRVYGSGFRESFVLRAWAGGLGVRV